MLAEKKEPKQSKDDDGGCETDEEHVADIVPSYGSSYLNYSVVVVFSHESHLLTLPATSVFRTKVLAYCRGEDPIVAALSLITPQAMRAPALPAGSVL